MNENHSSNFDPNFDNSSDNQGTNSTTSSTTNSMVSKTSNPQAQTLEQKLTRLQEIQQTLSQKTVSLSESMPLLEEAFRLKKEIESELESMQNKLIKIAKNDQNAEEEL